MLRDIRVSARVAQRGLTEVLCDIVHYCFAGDLTPPPHITRDHLATLVSGDSALVWVTSARGQPALRVHPWPSRLTRAHAKLV